MIETNTQDILNLKISDAKITVSDIFNKYLLKDKKHFK